VLVALLVGFDVATVLFASGMATVVALFLSKLLGKKFIPLYYGSSFSYIAATWALTGAQFGEYAGAELVQLAQVGIVATGVINILIGILVRLTGKAALDKVLPPIVTGSVALVIGVTLSGAALNMAFGGDPTAAGTAPHLIVAIVTLLVTILCSVYLRGKGFIGLIPILLGAAAGYLVSIPFGLIDLSPLLNAAWIEVPKFTLPAFGHPRAFEAVAAIARSA
jgi:uracil permease